MPFYFDIIRWKGSCKCLNVYIVKLNFLKAMVWSVLLVRKSYCPIRGDCRKCLHFNYCTDKGNHDYCGCSKYFVDKDEYVKVVRCKDCCCSIDIDGICYCTYWSKNTDPMGYCHESC